MRTVIAITGASGSNFALNFIEKCPSEKYLVVSKWGKRVIFEELGVKYEEIKSMVDNTFPDNDLASPFASGSNHFDSLVILPCSISTLNKIASGISDTLITRMAQIALKERRRLIIAVRETPLDSITLENALKLSNAGAIIAPVCPGLYMEESSISDLANTFSKKILSLIGAEKENGWRSRDIHEPTEV
ncbi:MAG: UbiX family flavin prenyltransferase [Thermodesulfobacteriota bacterium]|nr:UbiX family flavin prenyltransferase [Thermodesulfobacteriota bacterium]|tara:strand:+ start:2427 stop:2993 length:567 start_codon:yes stop_codon:yes gene_type:complete